MGINPGQWYNAILKPKVVVLTSFQLLSQSEFIEMTNFCERSDENFVKMTFRFSVNNIRVIKVSKFPHINFLTMGFYLDFIIYLRMQLAISLVELYGINPTFYFTCNINNKHSTWL